MFNQTTKPEVGDIIYDIIESILEVSFWLSIIGDQNEIFLRSVVVKLMELYWF